MLHPCDCAAVVLQGEANELRKQLGVARSLRNGSSPEFDEKMTRLKQLREMRKAILDKVGPAAGASCLWSVFPCFAYLVSATALGLYLGVCVGHAWFVPMLLRA
jgi:hypothetical protein